MTRQKFGEFLNYCALGGLAVFVILLIADVIPPTKRVGILMFSAGLLAGAVIGLLTDEVGIKAGSVKRSENPKGFWCVVVFNFIVSIIMFILSFKATG